MWQPKADVEVKVETAVKQFLPPCQISCPINEDIQRTNVLLSLLPAHPEQAKEGIIQIGDYLYERNPLFPVCGYICGLCERECNYQSKGGAVRRRLLKRFLADTYVSHLSEKKSLDVKKDKEKVAVVGGGPGGLMCAWELSRKGYNVTIFDSLPKLGGAVRYIPIYRLPENILDRTVDNLVRIGGIKIEKGVADLNDLKEQGFKAFFVATGTHYPRPLTFGRDNVEGHDLEGVMYGLTFLGEASKGNIPADYFEGKKVIVIGGGNVAFDAARTAYRVGGEVTVVCLENEDKTSKDGIPADIEEIEGAYQEGLKIVFSRGVNKIIGEAGKLKEIVCPKCTSVFDEKGFFNPRFDISNLIEIEGDILLITIGQMGDRDFLQNAGLFDAQGRMVVDTFTLQSMLKPDVFIGGDVRKIGFAADAMNEGIKAAEFIDKYLRGVDLKYAQITLEASDIPLRKNYKPQPELKWTPPEERKTFDLFEIGFTIDEAVAEAKRCLACGPCITCKACMVAGIQSELPAVNLKENLCSGCGVCVGACNYDAVQLKETNGRLISSTDTFKCKACGMCVSACPAGARELVPDIPVVETDGQKVVCFACKFSWGYLNGETTAKNWMPVTCLGKIDALDLIQAFSKGAEGILLLGCPEGDCHFQDGNCEAEKKVYLTGKILESFGIAKKRIELVKDRDPYGERITGLMNSFADRIKNLAG